MTPSQQPLAFGAVNETPTSDPADTETVNVDDQTAPPQQTAGARPDLISLSVAFLTVGALAGGLAGYLLFDGESPTTEAPEIVVQQPLARSVVNGFCTEGAELVAPSGAGAPTFVLVWSDGEISEGPSYLC